MSKKPSSNPNQRTTPHRLEGSSGRNDSKYRKKISPVFTHTNRSSPNQDYTTNEIYLQNLHTIRQRLKLLDVNVEKSSSSSPQMSGDCPRGKDYLSAQRTQLNLSEYVDEKENKSSVEVIYKSLHYKELQSSSSNKTSARSTSSWNSLETYYLPRKIPRIQSFCNMVNNVKVRNNQRVKANPPSSCLSSHSNTSSQDVELGLNLPSSISESSESILSFEPKIVTLERDSECSNSNCTRLSLDDHLSCNTSISEDPKRCIELIQDLDKHIKEEQKSSRTTDSLNTMESTEGAISEFMKTERSSMEQSMSSNEFLQDMKLDLKSSKSTQKYTPLEPNVVVLENFQEESDDSEDQATFTSKEDDTNAKVGMRMSEINHLVEILKSDQRQLQKIRWQIESNKIENCLKRKDFQSTAATSSHPSIEEIVETQPLLRQSQLKFFNPTLCCGLDIPRITITNPSDFPEISTIMGYLKETSSNIVVNNCKSHFELTGFREKAEQLLEEEQKDSCGTKLSLRLNETHPSKDQTLTTISTLRMARKTQSTLIDYYSFSPPTESPTDVFTDEFHQEIEEQVCNGCWGFICFPLKRRKYFV